ncbi:glycosyltransferase family 1 protein [Pseudohoeflea suaedae]|uniref:Glycosyltransferase family 1 protein n=1 Tax=Pseudohoeflea suaedae TaxID=877384 RepID=A0A4R5PQM0_9HYPH|nr:glycosyltransferase family 4 protein [Pseudohoeflea suaedae]TDH38991.1 glycosyltransferase family 1 protein [Pseudohoeflea suaedae]
MSETRPLRILHCFRSPVGGIFRHVRDLAEEHARAGHEVGILCDSITGGSFEDALFDGIRPHLSLGVRRLAIRRSIGPSDISSFLETYSEVKELKPDVLHGHGAKGGAFARMVGSRLRVSGSCVARLYSPHGGSLHYDRRSARGQLFFGIERMFERWTDSLVFVSDYERRTYAEKIGKPKADWELIHNGLRPGEFEPVTALPDAPEFLYIGMMRDLKGPDVFINSLRRAEQIVGRPLRAVMVGDGDDKPRYQAMIDRMGMGARISMHDAMPARQAFALARHVVVPSRAESMPYIVLEAIAAGKSMLATRVGGIPEILGTQSEALVEPDNVEAMSQAMAHAVMEENWLANAMPERDAFRERFSASRMAADMLALYEKLTSASQQAKATAAE